MGDWHDFSIIGPFEQLISDFESVIKCLLHKQMESQPGPRTRVNDRAVHTDVHSRAAITDNNFLTASLGADNASNAVRAPESSNSSSSCDVYRLCQSVSHNAGPQTGSPAEAAFASVAVGQGLGSTRADGPLAAWACGGFCAATTVSTDTGLQFTVTFVDLTTAEGFDRSSWDVMCATGCGHYDGGEGALPSAASSAELAGAAPAVLAPSSLLPLACWLGEPRFLLIRSASTSSFLGEIDRDRCTRLIAAARLAQHHLELRMGSTIPSAASSAPATASRWNGTAASSAPATAGNQDRERGLHAVAQIPVFCQLYEPDRGCYLGQHADTMRFAAAAPSQNRGSMSSSTAEHIIQSIPYLVSYRTDGKVATVSTASSASAKAAHYNRKQGHGRHTSLHPQHDGHAVAVCPPHVGTLRGALRNFAARLEDGSAIVSGAGGSSTGVQLARVGLPVSLEADSDSIAIGVGIDVTVSVKWRLGPGRLSRALDTSHSSSGLPVSTVEICAVWQSTSAPDNDSHQLRMPLKLLPESPETVTAAHLRAATSACMRVHWAEGSLVRRTGLLLRDGGAFEQHSDRVSDMRLVSSLAGLSLPVGSSLSIAAPLIPPAVGPGWLLLNCLGATASKLHSKYYLQSRSLHQARGSQTTGDTGTATRDPTLQCQCPVSARLMVLVEALRYARMMVDEDRATARAAMVEAHQRNRHGKQHRRATDGADGCDDDDGDDDHLDTRATLIPEQSAASFGEQCLSLLLIAADEQMNQRQQQQQQQPGGSSTDGGHGSVASIAGGGASYSRFRIADIGDRMHSSAAFSASNSSYPEDSSDVSDDDTIVGEEAADFEDAASVGDRDGLATAPTSSMPPTPAAPPLPPSQPHHHQQQRIRKRDRLRQGLNQLRQAAGTAAASLPAVPGPVSSAVAAARGAGPLTGVRAVQNAAGGVREAFAAAIASANLVLAGSSAVAGHAWDGSRYLRYADVQAVVDEAIAAGGNHQQVTCRRAVEEGRGMANDGSWGSGSATTDDTSTLKAAPLESRLARFATGVSSLIMRVLEGSLEAGVRADSAIEEQRQGRGTGPASVNSGMNTRQLPPPAAAQWQPGAPDFFGLTSTGLWHSLAGWAASEPDTSPEGEARWRVLQEVCLRIVATCWSAFVRRLREEWEKSLTQASDVLTGGGTAVAASTTMGSGSQTTPAASLAEGTRSPFTTKHQPIDHSQCLLQQKMQLLDLCCEAVQPPLPSIASAPWAQAVDVAAAGTGSKQDLKSRVRTASRSSAAASDGADNDDDATGFADASAGDETRGTPCDRKQHDGTAAPASPATAALPSIDVRVVVGSHCGGAHGGSDEGQTTVPGLYLLQPLIDAALNSAPASPAASTAFCPPESAPIPVPATNSNSIDATLHLEPVIAPVLQPSPPISEDTAIEDARSLSRQGAGALWSPLRPRLSLELVQADMVVFKRSNPRAGLIDFFRWYCPSMWRAGGSEVGVDVGDGGGDARSTVVDFVMQPDSDGHSHTVQLKLRFGSLPPSSQGGTAASIAGMAGDLDDRLAASIGTRWRLVPGTSAEVASDVGSQKSGDAHPQPAARVLVLQPNGDAGSGNTYFPASSVWSVLWRAANNNGSASRNYTPKPLFKPHTAAESALLWMETLPISEVVSQLIAAGVSPAMATLRAQAARISQQLGGGAGGMEVSGTDGSPREPPASQFLPVVSAPLHMLSADAARLTSQVDVYALAAVLAASSSMGGQGDAVRAFNSAAGGGGDDAAAQMTSGISNASVTRLQRSESSGSTATINSTGGSGGMLPPSVFQSPHRVTRRQRSVDGTGPDATATTTTSTTTTATTGPSASPAHAPGDNSAPPAASSSSSSAAASLLSTPPITTTATGSRSHVRNKSDRGRATPQPQSSPPSSVSKANGGSMLEDQVAGATPAEESSMPKHTRFNSVATDGATSRLEARAAMLSVRDAQIDDVAVSGAALAAAIADFETLMMRQAWLVEMLAPTLQGNANDSTPSAGVGTASVTAGGGAHLRPLVLAASDASTTLNHGVNGMIGSTTNGSLASQSAWSTHRLLAAMVDGAPVPLQLAQRHVNPPATATRRSTAAGTVPNPDDANTTASSSSNSSGTPPDAGLELNLKVATHLAGGAAQGCGSYASMTEYSPMLLLAHADADAGGPRKHGAARRGWVDDEDLQRREAVVQLLSRCVGDDSSSGGSPPVPADECVMIMTSDFKRALLPAALGPGADGRSSTNSSGTPHVVMERRSQPLHRMWVRTNEHGTRMGLRVAELDRHPG